MYDVNIVLLINWGFLERSDKTRINSKVKQILTKYEA